MSVEEGYEVNFDLAEFIDEWSDLFVVLGVFAALAVYISQITPKDISESSDIIRGGFVGSLIMTALLGFLIFKKVYERFNSLESFIRGFFHPRNIGLMVFFFAFTLILQFFISKIGDSQNILFHFIIAFSFMVGFSIFLQTFHKLSDLISPKSQTLHILSLCSRPAIFYMKS